LLSEVPNGFIPPTVNIGNHYVPINEYLNGIYKVIQKDLEHGWRNI